MATGGRICRWSIAGLTITACRAPRAISFRKTSRSIRQSRKRTRRERPEMSVGIMFVLVAAGVVGWWLFVRKLTAKPWEKKQSEADNEEGGATLTFVPSRVGLWVLLAVITSFFGLFFS